MSVWINVAPLAISNIAFAVRCYFASVRWLHSFFSVVFHFISFLHVLGGLPFSKAGFQGPSFKKKKIHIKGKIQPYNK